jgi:prevent-host-death family protein
MSMKQTLARTKEQLSAVVLAAQIEPQIITNRGREVAAIIPLADLERLQKLKRDEQTAGNLVSALQAVRSVWLKNPKHDGLPTEALQRRNREDTFALDR